MSDTYFLCDQYCIKWHPLSVEDTQSPYLDSPIAFIRFEGQSLAVSFLKSLSLDVIISELSPSVMPIKKIMG